MQERWLMVRKQNKTKRRENELRRAREIITREYEDIKSPYTPLEYGIVYESIAYEISRLSPSEDRIFGVTMARENRIAQPRGSTPSAGFLTPNKKLKVMS